MSLLSSVYFALKRLWIHRGLVACLLLGLAAAVALSVAVPMYADGVNYNLLNASLASTAAESRLPSFTFLFSYVGAWHGPITVEQYQPADVYLSEQAAGAMSLPLREGVEGLTHYVSTDNLQLYPSGQINRSQRLEVVKLAYVSNIFEHIQIIDGSLPVVASQRDAIDVLISLKMANDLGLQVGENYQLYQAGQNGYPPVQLVVRLAGVWTPTNPSSEFWFYPPESFEKRLLVDEETFFERVAESLPLPVSDAVWRLSFESSSVHSEAVPGLLARIGQVQNQVSGLLPNTTLDSSPVPALQQYRSQALALTSTMFVFSVPVLALILYFLGLVASMLVARQRSEIAVLRSRGASRNWVAAIYLLEWIGMGVAALALGTWLGTWLAYLVSRAKSFLDFSLAGGLYLRLAWNSLAFGVAAVVLAVIFSVWPAWQAGRDTIVSYKQEQARSRRKPLWQRAYLDLLLLLPALYGLYTLSQAGSQSTLRVLGRSLGKINPFENPLLFMLPTLFILAASLLVARLLPRLLAGLAWLATQVRWTVPVLALRQLSRSSSSHMGPLVLMVITLSLAAFVASMAHTFDRSLEDSIYYEIGADLNLVESGEYTGDTGINQPGPPGTPEQQPTRASDGPAVWNMLPVSDHLNLPGVQAAARVGRYEAELQAGGRHNRGRLIGLDRTDFPNVAFFRDDFAPEPLVGLMNRMALEPSALLIDRSTWERLSLSPGDQVQLNITFSSERRTLSFKAAGFMDYFPSLYPSEGPFFIGNLDYIFESFGGLLPYDVWLRTTPGTDTRDVVRGLNEMGVTVVRAQDVRQALQQTYTTPSRQGVLGLLSTGFLAASLLTVIGFLVYALLSFHQRFIQLGVLRAIGLSVSQMGAALALEQSLLVFTGMAAGTGIGIMAAYLFIPHLPMVVSARADILPSVVQIAWVDILRLYAAFGAMFAFGVGTTLASLRKMKLFQAVKLGEIA
ncbi:MAG TPA: FtsX-like permease family protein [Anaerolineales bacterium]|nr:FtsX-like permease family protein [Anaerolineales bacterium]